MALAVQAHDSQFGECPSGYTCDDGAGSPPDLVTGHTVYAMFVLEATRPAHDGPAGPPSPPIADAPGPGSLVVPASLSSRQIASGLMQAECVAWWNGMNLDVRPDNETLPPEDTHKNRFFSDLDDEPLAAGQDYDPGRRLHSCLPGDRDHPSAHYQAGVPTDFAAVSGYSELRVPATPWTPETIEHPNYAVVVEKGDCDPSVGYDFRFRGRLDFVDPNAIYHEVHEYDYVCEPIHSLGVPNAWLAASLVPAGRTAADTAKDLFPWTYTEPYAWDRCNDYRAPPGDDHFDWGHKCNGSVQDLFTERLWITPIHRSVFDATIDEPYNFALVADTCAGLNIHEHAFFGGTDPYEAEGLEYFLDSLGRGQPRTDVCHDGSSFSFDDTARGRSVHPAMPASGEEIERGNSLDSNANTTHYGMHRSNCRHNFIDWPYNDYPGRRPETLLREPPPRTSLDGGCFPEDHKTAAIDIYTYDADPTGQFLAHSNGLTGLNVYEMPPISGPDWTP